MMSRNQLAAHAGVSEKTVDRATRGNILRATRLGRRVLYAESDIADWLARCRV